MTVVIFFTAKLKTANQRRPRGVLQATARGRGPADDIFRRNRRHSAANRQAKVEALRQHERHRQLHEV